MEKTELEQMQEDAIGDDSHAITARLHLASLFEEIKTIVKQHDEEYYE
jgi:hypothetical protein